MDGYVVILVLALMVNSKVDGRSFGSNYHKWSNYGDRIVFEDDDIRRWQNSGESSEEWEHRSSYIEPSKKRFRNWDSDRVWFPDFGDKDFTVITASTAAVEVTAPPFSRNVNECIKVCPTTSEYNPVCGTNRVTYSNIGRLECAQLCGVDVRVLRRLPCSLVFEETTTTESAQTLGDEQRQCIEACPATPEYNPICGTNDMTYSNIGRLECARFCGIDVKVKRLSPCPSPTSTEPSAVEDLSVSDQPQRTTSSSSFTASTATPDLPYVTIPQYILDEIFNKPIEDSNEVGIDVRNDE